MRDGYMLDDPMFIAWQSGQREALTDGYGSWYDLVRETVRRGVEVRRARIVSEPVSEYIRFEHAVTFANVEAGELVRWLPRRSATDLALPGNDFWLIDGETLLINHFNGDGGSLGSEFVEDPAVAKLCATAFEAVWERAVPHAEYRLV
ncbi:hypothetical protein RKE29_17450 [Streptomyces sp. B1866]|uniref:DUF6879 family protein n=1 Tax=Streptomyces sp. B1866 TaxID=3075431 RepID=UPI00288F1656|nr:DUF6879 family protein [Streptomyces sp. B1866]MDT3398412.1 hypothetical protein [Streptomyces sp. B1866]